MMLRYYLLLSCLVYTVTGVAQDTKETWLEYTDYGVTYKLPANNKRYRLESTELTDDENIFKSAFGAGQPTVVLKNKRDGTKIRAGVIIMLGQVTDAPEQVAATLLEEIKKEFMSIPEFTIEKSEISKLNEQVHLSVTGRGAKELITVHIIIFSRGVIMLGSEDVSANGKETAYFLQSVKIE